MRDSRDTSWALIQRAVEGTESGTDELARLYRPAVIAYLRARWRGTPLIGETEDAVQEVFLDLIRPDGALSRLDPGRPGGFRAYLYGVVRFVALRFEERRGRRKDAAAGGESWPELEVEETSVSQAFDRGWASALLQQAAELQALRARDAGEDAERRVELLRLRFTEGLPIREIAELWEEDPGRVHHQYAKARREFRSALLHVVGALHPGQHDEVEAECARLLDFFV